MSDGGGVFHLSPLPSHCGLCFQALGDTSPSLVGGLHLCGTCDAGSVRERLEFRGFQFSETVEGSTTSVGATGLGLGLVSHGSRTHGESFTVVTSQVLMQRKLPVKIRFTPERDGGSLLSLFRRELQVGDELFDKSIYIESERDEVTQKLLSSPGLQSAVMEVVFDTGRLGIAGHTIWTQGFFSGGEVANAAGIRRALAVVTHFLDLFCQHLERPNEVAWP